MSQKNGIGVRRWSYEIKKARIKTKGA